MRQYNVLRSTYKKLILLWQRISNLSSFCTVCFKNILPYPSLTARKLSDLKVSNGVVRVCTHSGDILYNND